MIKWGIWCITTVLMKNSKKKHMGLKKNNINIYSLAAWHDCLHIWRSWNSLYTINAPLIDDSTKHDRTPGVPRPRNSGSSAAWGTTSVQRALVRMRCCGRHMWPLEVRRRKYSTVWPAMLMVSQAVKVFCYRGCVSSTVAWWNLVMWNTVRWAALALIFG